MKHAAFFAGLALALAACAPDKPASDAKRLAPIPVEKHDPPAYCKLVGPVMGEVLFGDEKMARAELEKNARAAGGNFVELDVIHHHPGGFDLQGRLFACPAEPPPPPPAPACQGPTEIACQPGCSPGYACLAGVCVSACNPPCGAGESCGADHSCHMRTSAERVGVLMP
jgi:hypothetical protein